MHSRVALRLGVLPRHPAPQKKLPMVNSKTLVSS